ncbi:hypothetical protein AKJ42_02635, partial [candidate division MSBL1 archaeon SCGC-AAA261C02]
RTWKKVDDSTADKIRSQLLGNGGIEQDVGTENEKWRIKFSDANFTYYKNGTLYCTPSSSKDPSVFREWDYIDSLVPPLYADPTREFLIGFDETGKGEVIGHMVLTGVIFPNQIFKKIEKLLGSADTKKRHRFEYWDGIFQGLDRFRGSGFYEITEKVPPWQIDKYNLNKMMDVTYQRILNTFFRKTEISQCRIVLDDYGIGSTLKRFLRFLKNQSAEVIVTSYAEEEYLEAKTAALISKRTREAVIKAINENPKFQVNGLSVGSGNAGDPKTIRWLERWHGSGKQWPWFVKKSFKTVREIEGKTGKARKRTPPIREDLLSEEFLEEFNRGNLSIESLSLVCPDCGAIAKTATFAIFSKDGRNISELKCSSCGELIRNANFTLRYYCNCILPDSSAIQRNLISKDLDASQFFEGFTVVLTPTVREECDGTSRGKTEFDKLSKYSQKGRIELESPGKLEELPKDISSEAKDERIIDKCIENNAILITGDKSMRTFAEGKDVFTIFI